MSLVTTQSDILCFVDGIPLPAPVTDVSYTIERDMESYTALGGIMDRPTGNRTILVDMRINGYMPDLDMKVLTVISDNTRLTVHDPTIIGSRGSQQDDYMYTEWDIVAESVSES